MTVTCPSAFAALSLSTSYPEADEAADVAQGAHATVWAIKRQDTTRHKHATVWATVIASSMYRDTAYAFSGPCEEIKIWIITNLIIG